MLKISDVMTQDVFTLEASASADSAAWALGARGFTGAPVQDERGRMVGVLSLSDLTDSERSQGRLENKEVQHLMTPAYFSLGPSEPASRAAQLMVREEIGRVVVMDGAGRMVGIVTPSDILRGKSDAARPFAPPTAASPARGKSNFAPI